MLRIRVATAATTVAAVCALAGATGAVLTTPQAAAVGAVHARSAGPAADPAPSESPCPGGEPKPCPASSKDRDEVDGDKAQVSKDEAKSKEDISAAKDQAAKCPPTSKQCMDDLAGNGKDQKDGMAKAQHQLDAEHPAPADNAQAAVGGACKGFSAQLPPGLTPSDAPDEPSRVCELMH
ncbi:hypothetical protein GXW82_36370 [Streptacidiphilus sp. 4-A2]|nr:hypothetical protein [Streptacidiphilus sp. 4-A2]